jgi:hypothetical protein
VDPMRPKERDAPVASMTAIDASAPPPALGPSRCSPVALVVGLIVLVSTISLLVGSATLPDLLLPLVDVPGVAVNRVTAAPVVLSRDGVKGTGDPRFLFTAIDSIAADLRVGPAMTHRHLGAEPIARLSTSADSRKQTNGTPASSVAELARGTRAESALLATIETRRDDPRVLLLRTAAWSRERGRTKV